MTEPLDIDIVQLARSNDAFRREIATGEHSQIVTMTIPAGGEIGEEVHEENDQLLVFIDGEGDAVLDGRPPRSPPTTWSWSPPAPATTSSTPATAPCAWSPSTPRPSTPAPST